MEIDDPDSKSLKEKAEALHRLATGSMATSVSKLSNCSRAIPSEKDFHFFYNFDEFKTPVKEIEEKSQFMLQRVGASNHLWGKDMVFPDDLDDAYDWLVNVNDELFERFDVSTDEFQSLRKKQEEGAKVPAVSDDGFQLVCGKKKKGMVGRGSQDEKNVNSDANGGGSGSGSSAAGVKVASRANKAAGVKPKVPFHIPSIPRPQDSFNILVNNTNQPFQHVWLQRSEDGTRFVHPLENLSVLDFVEKDTETINLAKPPPVEHTPFKFVEEVNDLKELAAKLRAVDEFAVDLEHNQYRSFQGMTCLMQISTRSEDFIVDTLKLRIHVGPYLRELFKDPSKKKVMHGADRDILWLQRDFGIYVCNLFDTGQASRVLKLERNSLEFLLHHYCGVSADKEYQNADWRLRPLPYEMIKYAREDTHYLLHIYDLMRIKLLSTSTESEGSDYLLVEVYKRSYDVCMQLYEKELLTESSYLHIYGLQGADLDSQQLAVVAGLCEWRDVVARAEDESTGFILPNKTLLEIGKQMPVSTSKLRRLLKMKHPYVERNLSSVVSIIRLSVQNAPAFEDAAEQLKQLAAEQLKQLASQQLKQVTAETDKEGQMKNVSEDPMVDADGPETLLPGTSENFDTVNNGQESIDGTARGNNLITACDSTPPPKEVLMEVDGFEAEIGSAGQSSDIACGKEKVKKEMDCIAEEKPGGLPTSGHTMDRTTRNNGLPSEKVTGVTIQLVKKASRGFGAMLGNSSTKRKAELNPKYPEQSKLEQIKASVNLPFFSFSGKDVAEESAKVSESSLLEPLCCVPQSKSASETSLPEDLCPKLSTSTDGVDDIILLEASTNVSAPDDSDEGLSGNGNKTQGTASDLDKDHEPSSLSNLSSTFQKCFQSIIKTKGEKMAVKSQEPHGLLQVKPFDYEAALEHFRFGEKASGPKNNEDDGGKLNSGTRRKTLGKVQSETDDGAGLLPQGKRRQAFPVSGNRSATFR